MGGEDSCFARPVQALRPLRRLAAERRLKLACGTATAAVPCSVAHQLMCTWATVYCSDTFAVIPILLQTLLGQC